MLIWYGLGIEVHFVYQVFREFMLGPTALKYAGEIHPTVFKFLKQWSWRMLCIFLRHHSFPEATEANGVLLCSPFAGSWKLVRVTVFMLNFLNSPSKPMTSFPPVSVSRRGPMSCSRGLFPLQCCWYPLLPPLLLMFRKRLLSWQQLVIILTPNPGPGREVLSVLPRQWHHWWVSLVCIWIEEVQGIKREKQVWNLTTYAKH